MRRLRSKAEAAAPASLDELLGLIIDDEETLTKTYGSWEAAVARFRILRARGEICPGLRSPAPAGASADGHAPHHPRALTWPGSHNRRRTEEWFGHVDSRRFGRPRPVWMS
jgi:hypothetical protein